MSATGQNQHDITSDQSMSNQKPDWQARHGKEDDRQGRDGGPLTQLRW